MSWDTIDFQGIVCLDNTVADALINYLDEKEEDLAYEILDSIPPNNFEPLSRPTVTGPLKLEDSIEIFIKKDYHSNSRPAINYADWERSVKKINDALWSYVEILEDSVLELFQQLEQIGLEQWHTRLSQVVGTIKDTLIHKSEDLIWDIQRLEKQLWKCRLACEPYGSWKTVWLKLDYLRSPILDRKLIPALNNIQESLKSQFQKFNKRYKGFLQLQEEVDKSIERLSTYQVFSQLEPEVQRQFRKLYQLLKLWDLNRTAKALPSREFVIALRNTLSTDRALSILKEYYNALKKRLFEDSLALKQTPEKFSEASVERNRVEDDLVSCRAESTLLGVTISNYREFILRSDPDPYARTRLGFSDTLVGPEPEQTKPLLDLGYDIETLLKLYEQLADAVNTGPERHAFDLNELDRRIQEILHEMMQPLATQRKMRSWAEQALDLLQQADELGSYDPEVISYTGEALAKLMRADWKYHVLYGFPLFHELYSTHQGLITLTEDRLHLHRLEKFQRLINQIQDWVKNRKVQAHFHDIELDVNDIKGYLQDFLGYVQRTLGDHNLTRHKYESLRKQLSQELLDYRYLFGNFFYQLHQNESEGILIRKQFLFVDQYFETIDNKLHEERFFEEEPSSNFPEDEE